VLGGGVAGSALALLAARRGLAVVLVERGRPKWSGPHETLLAAGRSRLERIGLADAVAAAAVPDRLRHGALWGSDEVAWRDDDGEGLLLARGRFDAALRQAAASAGAVVAANAETCPTREGWRVRTPDGELPLQPRLVVDARGRIANPRRLAAHRGHGLLAVTLVGRAERGDLGTATVEATADGWIWTHAPADGPAAAAVLVDGDEAAACGVGTLVRRVLAAARGPAARLRDARAAHANDATARAAAAAGDRLAIGDAAATIDPLASQGVEKALFAADHAAAVGATALQRPEWLPRLLAAHARWELGLWHAHEATSADWYAREQRFRDAPFWRRRRPAPAAAEPPDDQPLVVSPSIVASEVLARAGDTFVARPGFHDRRDGDEQSHVGYVPIAALLDRFAAPTALPAAVAAAGGDPRLFVLPPRAVDAAMRALRRRGWLIPAPPAATSR
jgi:flavin-dependent dehydrogenase